MYARTGIKQVTIEAVKTRADGTQVPLGTIGYWHRNPLRRLVYRLRRKR